MTHEDEAAPVPEDRSPAPLMRVLDDLESLAGGAEGRSAAFQAAKNRVAQLIGEVARLERLNAAMERENDALNAAMLALAIERRLEPSAPDAEQAPPVEADAPAQEPAEPYFAVSGAREVFSHNFETGPAQVFFARKSASADAPRVTLSRPAIGAGEAGCDIVLGASDAPPPNDWSWTREKRAELSGAFEALAEALGRALRKENAGTPTGEAAEAWSAVASYLSAIGQRTRSPAADGIVVGPVAIEGLGPRESLAVSETEAKTVRWTTQRTARLLVFVTRKGRLAFTVAARSLASEQALILRLDGAVLVDEDLPADAAERAAAFGAEAAVDWGPHVLEIEGPAYVREQDGAFRTLHLLVEDLGVSWRAVDEHEESEAELFGWAPPLARADAAG